MQSDVIINVANCDADRFAVMPITVCGHDKLEKTNKNSNRSSNAKAISIYCEVLL